MLKNFWIKFRDFIYRYLGSRTRLWPQNSSVEVIFDAWQNGQNKIFKISKNLGFERSLWWKTTLDRNFLRVVAQLKIQRFNKAIFLGSRLRLRIQNSSVGVIFYAQQNGQKFFKIPWQFRKFPIISKLSLSPANLSPSVTILVTVDNLSSWRKVP